VKPVSEFHKRGNGYQWICKLCRKGVDREYYQKDPQRHWDLRRRRREELLAWFRTLKEERPCVDCEQTFHFAAMQWDHIGTDKVANVSDMVFRGFSKKRILNEITKCELVCANCHALRTHLRHLEENGI
jgi:hypothetical protein